MNETYTPDKLRFELGYQISVRLDIERSKESRDEDKDVGLAEELAGANPASST